MRVENLELEDFRNYERASVEFSAGLNVVVGRNAQGKTNLLEAVACLGGLGSPRAADHALVREGCERSLLHAAVLRGGRVITLDLELQPGRGTRVLINKAPASGSRALSEVFVCVFFGPDEPALVKGAPEGRRRFLDDVVVKLRPSRSEVRREFERTLKQRNALLRSAPHRAGAAVHTTLDVWDDAFARAAGALVGARIAALSQMRPHAAKRYEEIAGGGRLELSYESTWVPRDGPDDEASFTTALRAALETERPRELERGTSLVGPQRDDVGVRVGSGQELLEARSFASQGDQRTAALALRLAEHDLLSEALGEEPVLLLDDVFSELDPARRAWLAGAVRSVGQTIVSSVDAGVPELEGARRAFEVVAGRVARRG